MLFLVQGTVVMTGYMEDRSIEEPELRIVDAETEDAAILKFVSFFEDKSDAYGTSYRVRIASATGVIQ